MIQQGKVQKSVSDVEKGHKQVIKAVSFGAGFRVRVVVLICRCVVLQT